MSAVEVEATNPTLCNGCRHPEHGNGCSQVVRRHGGKCRCRKSSVDSRFWQWVDIRVDGCWEWTGSINNKGYGRTSVKRRPVYAHRVAYELCVGPIPDGHELDHLCRNPRCVNPEHLEPVTHRVNLLRGQSPMAHQARQTHCLRGHPFDAENTYHRPDREGRQCRTCNRLRQARRLRQGRAA